MNADTDGVAIRIPNLRRLIRHVARLYCAIDSHRWRSARLRVGATAEGFDAPLIWKPRRVCRRCGAAEVEVGFPAERASLSKLTIDESESGVVTVDEWSR